MSTCEIERHRIDCFLLVWVGEHIGLWKFNMFISNINISMCQIERLFQRFIMTMISFQSITSNSDFQSVAIPGSTLDGEEDWRNNFLDFPGSSPADLEFAAFCRALWGEKPHFIMFFELIFLCLEPVVLSRTIDALKLSRKHFACDERVVQRTQKWPLQ